MSHGILLAATSLLLSCATIHTTPRYSPATGAYRMVARSEINKPLEPGRERFDYPLQPSNSNEPLVLMAIAGGGSRSAYYAARVMEELSAIPNPAGSGSMLDSVHVISTISAGSLAAAWYIYHYDERQSPDFFQRFKSAMAVNLQWRTYGHMALFPPLALQLAASSITRTDLLANEMERLLGGKPVTFDDLRALETRPDDRPPALIVNGTAMNSGQRVVMTNLPPSRFPSQIAKAAPSITVSPTDREILRRLVQPITFEDIGSDIGSFRVAQAIAASSAYPIALAPLRLNIYPDHVNPALAGRIDSNLMTSKFLYVADGGMYENEGIDPLLSVLRTIDRNQPVLLLIVDASQRMETIKVSGHKIWDPFTVVGRLYDIGTLRPLAFYGTAAREFHDPAKLDGVVIRMEGYDEHSTKILRNIPTMFKLSRQHRAALDLAAQRNVADMQDSLVEAYTRLGKVPSKKRR